MTTNNNTGILSATRAAGIAVPSWAVATLPVQQPATAYTKAVSADARAAGGLVTPSGAVVRPWQSAWRPYHVGVNPLRIEPEQHSANSYAYYDTAFNSQYQPFPKVVSTSGRFATIPVQYGREQYSYLNPVANAGFR